MGSRSRRSVGTIESGGDMSEESASMYSGSISSGSYGGGRRLRRQLSANRFRWSSNTDYILYTTVCTLSALTYSYMTQHHSATEDPNVLQFLVVYAVIGLPLVYLQVVIGQYTQMSIIFIKHMCPIAHGVAYTALLNILAHTIDRAIFLSIFMVYLLTSFRGSLQWHVCPDSFGATCWNGISLKYNCTLNCLINRKLSANIYYQAHFIEEDRDAISVKLPFEVKKVLPLMAAGFFLTICLLFTHNNYKLVLVVLLVASLICLVIFFLGCILTEGGLTFMTWLPKLNTNRFFSLKTWTRAIGEMYSLLALGRPFHVMAGSFLTPSANSGILAVAAIAINFIVAYFMSWIALSCYGIVKMKSFTDEEHMANFTHGGIEIIFHVIPQALQFMGIPQLWSTIYFIGCTLLQTNNLIVSVMALEKSICDTNPKLLRYTMYMTVLISTLTFSICMFVYTAENYGHYVTIKYAIGRASAFSTCIITAVICLLYGVQKLCDDIHFMSGAPPTKFWKICWYISAPLNITYFIANEFYQTEVPHEGSSVITATVIFSATPIFICAALEIFRYMKRQNLIGLFKPTEAYGPPDPEDKYLRHVHNPRHEIKSRRRNDACVHRCFLGNRAYRKAVIESKGEGSLNSNDSIHTLDLALSMSQIDMDTLRSKSRSAKASARGSARSSRSPSFSKFADHYEELDVDEDKEGTTKKDEEDKDDDGDEEEKKDEEEEEEEKEDKDKGKKKSMEATFGT